MKYLKFLLAAILTAAVFYGLNTRFGAAPAMGPFLNPSTGIWQNEQSLDASTEDVQIPGLHSPVQVLYDENLIPHIFAQNDTDMYLAQGYITARHRLWQMEFQTFAAAGRVSEIIGEKALDYDRGQRRKGMVYGAEQALEKMKDDPLSTMALQAYCDGVNAYIHQLEPGDYPVEYKLLGYVPEDWTTTKTALLLMHMTGMLAGGDDDLEYTNFLKHFGRENFDLLYPDFFDVVDPVIPAQEEWKEWEVEIPRAPGNNGNQDFLAEGLPNPDPDNGSNNWAVGPSKSATGNAILANDPHLGLNLPSIWFALQMSTPTQNTFGVSLPGAAGIIIGFNEHIAWGVTNATRDVRDWYKISFKDKGHNQYRYGNDWKTTTKRLEEIKIKGKESFFDTVVYTHYGPVTYDEHFRGNGQRTGYAMKWTGHLGGNTQRTFLELNKAKNYDEYVKAISYYVAPAQNFIFASTQGNIALWVQGKFPNKWKEQGKFLMDGSDPQNEWQGFIPQEHNAHVENPERGFVSSANQHPVDTTYPYYVFNDGYETYRNRVINNFLRSKDSVGIDDFKSLHNNTYNLKAAELLPFMMDTMNTSVLNDHEMQVLNELRGWDFYNDIQKTGPSIWELWWEELENLTWDELKQDSLALKYPFDYQTVYLLKHQPTNHFMDIDSTSEVETAPDLYLISFRRAVQRLDEWAQGHDGYEWGKFKATYVGHLLQALPAFSRFDIPIGGNRGIVNATSKNHGPSWRMIVEMSSPPRAWAIYPGGESGNPGSKFYDNLIDQWAAGEYMEVRYLQSPDDTAAVIFSKSLNPEK